LNYTDAAVIIGEWGGEKKNQTNMNEMKIKQTNMNRFIHWS